ncbi:MAG: hypothetical protein AAGE80_11060 [Pseudomonadota bacterium]
MARLEDTTGWLDDKRAYWDAEKKSKTAASSPRPGPSPKIPVSHVMICAELALRDPVARAAIEELVAWQREHKNIVEGHDFFPGNASVTLGWFCEWYRLTAGVEDNMLAWAVATQFIVYVARGEVSGVRSQGALEYLKVGNPNFFIFDIEKD